MHINDPNLCPSTNNSNDLLDTNSLLAYNVRIGCYIS